MICYITKVAIVLLLIQLPVFSYAKRLPDHSIVTNPLRSDGFGAQFQTIIYSVIYAELNHMNYEYTPFKSMEHNYEMDPEFIAKKEWLINFMDHFPLCRNPSIQSSMHPGDFINFFENNLKACASSQSLSRIKKIFFENKNRGDFFDQRDFHIAVHIRRPNPHDSRIDGTNTADNVYLKIIQSLKKTYAEKNPVFHIYSQGDIEYFYKTFGGERIIFHLDESVEETFTALAFADVLVTSRSSFSYTAGIISEGIVYYIPFWHPPLPNWITLKT